MAHFLFIWRYYLPEKAYAAVCISETAKRLAKLGHQVTVLITVPNYPTRLLARVKHCPFIFWVADLWPESAIQFGILHNRLFIKLSEEEPNLVIIEE